MEAYRNPILPGFHPDPSICRVGEDFYLVTSSFEFFPGLPEYHSRDLIHWRRIGHVVERVTQASLLADKNSEGLWAPTLRYHRGWFYIAVTHRGADVQLIFRARAPEGPWSEPLTVALPGIDPTLFFDDAGAVYFSYRQTGSGVFQARIDLLSPSYSGPRWVQFHAQTNLVSDRGSFSVGGISVAFP